MKVEVINIEYVNGEYLQYRTIPARYSSRFNKLSKVSESYKIYCKRIECDFSELKKCDESLVVTYLLQEIDKVNLNNLRGSIG